MPFATAIAIAGASSAITTAASYYYPFATPSTATTTITYLPHRPGLHHLATSTGLWIDHSSPVRDVSNEYRAGIAARRAAWDEQYEQAQRARELTMQRAQRRAKSLLEEFLTPLQREQLRDLGAFTMRGASGQRYRIREGRTSNVAVLGPDNRPLHRLCAHPSELLPDADTMLTQLFMLRDAEAEQAFLAEANRH